MREAGSDGAARNCRKNRWSQPLREAEQRSLFTRCMLQSVHRDALDPHRCQAIANDLLRPVGPPSQTCRGIERRRENLLTTSAAEDGFTDSIRNIFCVQNRSKLGENLLALLRDQRSQGPVWVDRCCEHSGRLVVVPQGGGKSYRCSKERSADLTAYGAALRGHTYLHGKRGRQPWMQRSLLLQLQSQSWPCSPW